MLEGVKGKAPVKNPQSPTEYPGGTEYVEPHVVYELVGWLMVGLSDM